MTDYSNNSVADSGNDNSQTDNSLHVADSNNDNSDGSSASGGRFAANNGSTVTDNSDNSKSDSGNDNSTMTDNSDNSMADNSNNSVNTSDSGNDNSHADNSTSDSGNDNSDNRVDASVHIADSGNDYSTRTGTASSDNVFGDGAIVASSTLSSYVTGVSVTFNGSSGDGTTTNNSLRVEGSAFQNFAGMQALNQNTGVGASQNASVSVAVSTGDVAF